MRTMSLRKVPGSGGGVISNGLSVLRQSGAPLRLFLAISVAALGALVGNVAPARAEPSLRDVGARRRTVVRRVPARGP
jgi:hypothetical protein